VITDRNLDGAVGIVAGYGLNGLGVGFRVPVGSTISFTPSIPDFWPRIQWVQGMISPGVIRPVREAGHSTSAEVKETWIYSTVPKNVNGMVLN
jgi:hypothetical protein